MSTEQSTAPVFYRPSQLRKDLEEGGHRLTDRRIAQMCSEGKVDAVRTQGGQWRIPEAEYRRVLKERGGTPSRSRPDKPRKNYEVGPDYLLTLRRRYGITPGEYRHLCEANDYCCTVCGQRPDEVRAQLHVKARRLNVDHDHHTGEIRGLVCQRCNVHVSFTGENVVQARRILAYLEGRLAPPQQLEILRGKRYKQAG